MVAASFVSTLRPEMIAGIFCNSHDRAVPKFPPPVNVYFVFRFLKS
jgi:hypothetical protein